MQEPTTRARLLLGVMDERWQGHRAALVQAFADAIRGLEELVQVDDYHHDAHERSELERSLGPLGANNLDLGSLSRMLSESTHSRAMPQARLERVQGLIPELAGMKKGLPTNLSEWIPVDIERDTDEILQLAEEHLNRAAQVFRALRVAQMEVRSKYEAETDDAYFEDFTWRQLAPSELRLCPPFVVAANLDENGRAASIKIMSLLATGMPIKVVAVRSSLREAYPAGADSGPPAALSVEMLPLAMRGVHFVQTCAGIPDYQSQLFEALVAPRPAVLSVLAARDDEEPKAFAQRAEVAVRSRAFPVCTYDPDRATRFVDCLDLSSNPSPGEIWVSETLRGSDPIGHEVEQDEPLTFAHFAANDADFERELSDPPEGTDGLVPIAEYLDLSRYQKAGKLPFVWCIGKDGSVVRKVVSPAVALQCADRRHLWRTLREIAGVDNPHVEAARTALRQELTAQKNESVARLRAEMEEQAARREKAAVENAVRNLVARLTGADG